MTFDVIEVLVYMLVDDGVIQQGFIFISIDIQYIQVIIRLLSRDRIIVSEVGIAINWINIGTTPEKRTRDYKINKIIPREKMKKKKDMVIWVYISV